MKKKEFLHEIAQKLLKIRETLGLSASDITGNIKVHRVTYYKYENGMAFPHFTVLSRLGNSLGISLDWLILNKGSMLYKEKVSANAAANPLDALPGDIRELVEHMERIPMLKYETLLSFHQFKEKHKELVESSIKEKITCVSLFFLSLLLAGFPKKKKIALRENDCFYNMLPRKKFLQLYKQQSNVKIYIYREIQTHVFDRTKIRIVRRSLL